MQMGNPKQLEALMKMNAAKKPSASDLTRLRYLQMLQTPALPSWQSPANPGAIMVNGGNG